MYIGNPLERVEDNRFLRGGGTFVDDVTLPDMAYAAFVRSPHAHAVIRGISSEATLATPGVTAVLTGEDWAREGRGATACVGNAVVDALWHLGVRHVDMPMTPEKGPRGDHGGGLAAALYRRRAAHFVPGYLCVGQGTDRALMERRQGQRHGALRAWAG